MSFAVTRSHQCCSGCVFIVFGIAVGYLLSSLLLQDGESALLCAASRGNLECVRCLLAHQANINLQDKVNTTRNMTASCSEKRSYSWLTCGSVEWKLCPKLLHMIHSCTVFVPMIEEKSS